MNIPALERAVIEIVGSCNYSCKMCPQTTGRDTSFLKKMPLDVFESILDQLPGKPIINLEGSGEPTLAKDLPLYVEACTRRGLKSYMYCNGSRLSGSYMNDVVDAGISLVRFSCIGYNKEKYNEWMKVDNFDLIKENIRSLKDYAKKTNSNCIVASYHLILDNNFIDFEVQQYRNNFIDELKTVGYIWKMHNWSGNYSPTYIRNSKHRKTCGRPFAPEITIRAGGIGDRYGAVTPCCQTLGPPNEQESVLGHADSNSLNEIWFGEKYSNLRQLHRENKFDSISYCKNCDFLYEDPEVLVWSNDSNALIGHMLGTNFNLNDYKDQSG